jgi:hypothetical protein
MALNTPLQTCLDAVQDRRAVRGVDVPLNQKNTADKHAYAVRKVAADRAVGLNVHMLDRGEAYLFYCF